MTPETPDLDPDALARLQRIGGGRFVSQMIDLFLEHAPVRIASAVMADREGNPPAVGQAMHALKSSAGNVGARRVQELAEAIEMAVETAATPYGQSLRELEAAFASLEPQLRKLRGGADHETDRRC